MAKNILNPGSALGEAIGVYMEVALNRYLTEILEDLTCHLISKGGTNQKTGKEKKLLLYDKHGTGYNIDAVITDEDMKPLILVEYKYIRYKKHNRDKGSWVCTAHSAVRRRYTSIRSSIAILAGNWSKTSLTMMVSHDINIFLIPFDRITELLAKHGIVFDWDEKDRNTAVSSWGAYEALSEDERLRIAEEMILIIKDDLKRAILQTLDDTVMREVKKIVIEIHTNLGEVLTFEFSDAEEAVKFLSDFGLDDILNPDDAIAIFDGAPSGEDGEILTFEDE